MKLIIELTEDEEIGNMATVLLAMYGTNSLDVFVKDLGPTPEPEPEPEPKPKKKKKKKKPEPEPTPEPEPEFEPEPEEPQTTADHC
jgi:hypothetical protein